MDVTELIAEVRKWLTDKPGPMTEKAKDLGVSYFWLQRFLKDEQQPNITTDRLQMLVERMTAEKRTKRSAGEHRASA